MYRPMNHNPFTITTNNKYLRKSTAAEIGKRKTNQSDGNGKISQEEERNERDRKTRC